MKNTGLLRKLTKRGSIVRKCLYKIAKVIDKAFGENTIMDAENEEKFFELLERMIKDLKAKEDYVPYGVDTSTTSNDIKFRTNTHDYIVPINTFPEEDEEEED